jgi:5'-3' exonuclease
MKRILLIDSLNAMLRAINSDPHTAPNGQHAGGIRGYLKILQKMIRITNPDRIFILWDGAGGSKKRKRMFKEYKAGRSPLFVNPNIKSNPDDSVQNRIWQETRVVEYLNQLPLIQLMIEGVEADDLIAYIVKDIKFDEYQKVICSNDKDFLQLLDDKTVLYRPVKEQVLNKKTVIDEYGIHPLNFALARAISGDESDNLEGVRGAGLTILAKRFTFLAEEIEHTLDDILLHCREHKGEIKLYANILTEQKKIKLNQRVMQLSYRPVTVETKKKINSEIKGAECILNKPIFERMAVEDGIGDIDFTILFENMNKLVIDNCKEKG